MPCGEQLADDAHALLGRLAGSVHGLRQALAEGAVVIDEGVAEIGEREPAQAGDDLVGVDSAGGQVVEQCAQRRFVHRSMLPDLGGAGRRVIGGNTCPDRPCVASGSSGRSARSPSRRCARSPTSRGRAGRLPHRARRARRGAGGEVDVGVVPIENSIEGVVNFTQDALAFDYDLLIQREIVLDIEHCLVGPPGLDSTTSRSCSRSRWRPRSATASCASDCRTPRCGPRNSTAEAARLVAEDDVAGAPAIAARVAAERYGLDVLAGDIADHPGNQTRFVVVARDGIPAPTGHDRTAMVVYQRADEPGSLISILQEFAARRINLSNLLSRPTKAGGLGDYCFVIYADAHIADELMADALRALHAKQGGGEVPRVVPGGRRARPHRPRARRRPLAQRRRLGPTNCAQRVEG